MKVSHRILVVHGLHAGERIPWTKVLEELRGHLRAGEHPDVRRLLENLTGRDYAALIRALRRQDEALYQAYREWWSDDLRRHRVEVTLRGSRGRPVE